MWKKIFGWFGKEEKKPLQLELSGLESFLEKRFEKQKAKFEKNAGLRFAEIKHLLKSIQAAIAELEKADFSSDNQKLSGIARTSKRHSINQLSSLAEKLVPPDSISSRNVLSYSDSSLSLLERESRFFGKNIAYTSFFLKEETKDVGKRFGELVETIQKLRSECIENSNAVLLEKIFETKKAFLLQSQDALETEKTLSEAKQDILFLKKKLDSLHNDLSCIQESKEFFAFSSLDKRKKSLLQEKEKVNAELLAFFSPIDKPLRRFNALVKADKFFLENREQEILLAAMLNNPASALRKDPNGLRIKQLLSEVKNAVESNTVALKASEKEKKIAALNSLLEANLADSFFWKLNELEKQAREIDTGISESDFSEKLSSKKKDISFCLQEVEKASLLQHSLEKELSAKKSALAYNKISLEKALAGALGEKSVVLVD